MYTIVKVDVLRWFLYRRWRQRIIGNVLKIIIVWYENALECYWNFLEGVEDYRWIGVRMDNFIESHARCQIGSRNVLMASGFYFIFNFGPRKKVKRFETVRRFRVSQIQFRLFCFNYLAPGVFNYLNLNCTKGFFVVMPLPNPIINIHICIYYFFRKGLVYILIWKHRQNTIITMSDDNKSLTTLFTFDHFAYCVWALQIPFFFSPLSFPGSKSKIFPVSLISRALGLFSLHGALSEMKWRFFFSPLASRVIIISYQSYRVKSRELFVAFASARVWKGTRLIYLSIPFFCLLYFSS